MSRPGAKPNGQIAWLVAGAAVALILALPSVAEAQNNRPMRQSGPAQNNGSGNGNIGSSRGSQFDIFDYRDVIMNTMVVAPAPNALPSFARDEIVCLAGCDRGAGSVVYRNESASIMAKATDALLSPNTPSREALASANSLSCVAGCYEPPKVRTVASLRQMQTAPSPVRTANRPKPVADMPRVAALDRPAPHAGGDTAVRLKSAFSASEAAPSVGRAPAQARVRGNSRAKVRAPRSHDYGKMLKVPQPAQQVPIQAARNGDVSPATEETKSQPLLRDSPRASADRSAPAPSDMPSRTPVTRFSATNRPTPEPAATVSNDWFNKINRERKAKDAAQKEPKNIVDVTAD